MAFYKKRDHIQIITEILSLCKSPQTKGSIRRQTSISYAILQNCVKQLLLNQGLEPVEDSLGQKKIAITQKGLVFLEKYLELQSFIGIKNKQKSMMATPEIQACLTQRM